MFHPVLSMDVVK